MLRQMAADLACHPSPSLHVPFHSVPLLFSVAFSALHLLKREGLCTCLLRCKVPDPTNPKPKTALLLAGG